MSNNESINLSIKIDGKAIDFTYEAWIEIHNLYRNAMTIQKTYLMLFFLMLYCHASFSNKI
jgi:hypothetical protein